MKQSEDLMLMQPLAEKYALILGPPRKLGLEIIRAYPSPLGKGGKALALGERSWGTSASVRS